MNDPSSRTPEGVPHQCDVCGTEFRLNRSIAGDVCCPNCNSLAWPVGDDDRELRPSSDKTTTVRTKEIRIRPATHLDMDLGDEARRVRSLLQKRNDVRVSVLFRGRDPKHKEIGKAILDRFISSLVPDDAIVKTPAHLEARRISCTLTSPERQPDG
ncbi:hypothetical protein SH528x_002992 [Novipirellula sp. SH528]|uniref:hypothetical protein n=1 Tax=Novipirellula sp. SH528 TaxID=3454466 RepID=UPI003FA0440D